MPYRLYFRAWHRFGRGFPFERFQGLTDQELPAQLNRFGAEWLEEHEDEIVRQERLARQKREGQLTSSRVEETGVDSHDALAEAVASRIRAEQLAENLEYLKKYPLARPEFLHEQAIIEQVGEEQASELIEAAKVDTFHKAMSATPPDLDLSTFIRASNLAGFVRLGLLVRGSPWDHRQYLPEPRFYFYRAESDVERDDILSRVKKLALDARTHFEFGAVAEELLSRDERIDIDALLQATNWKRLPIMTAKVAAQVEQVAAAAAKASRLQDERDEGAAVRGAGARERGGVVGALMMKDLRVLWDKSALPHKGLFVPAKTVALVQGESITGGGAVKRVQGRLGEAVKKRLAASKNDGYRLTKVGCALFEEEN